MRFVSSSNADEDEQRCDARRPQLAARYEEVLRSANPAGLTFAAQGSPPATMPSTGPAPRARGGQGRGGARTQKATPQRARLEQTLDEAANKARPTPRVRSDYFGTAEHKALADLLRDVLAGKPLAKPAGVSHVLFARKPGLPATFDGALAVSSLDLVDTGNEWARRLADEVCDVIAQGLVDRELPVRPDFTLGYGDIVALAGDYYGSPEDLAKDVDDEIKERIRKVTPASPGTTWLSLQRGIIEYGLLALRNVDHFSPHNWFRYARHHCEALLLALDRRFEEALVRNAFADHFLTDAFAAGHLRVPRTRIGMTGAYKMHKEDNDRGLWVSTLGGLAWHAYGDDHLGDNPVHLMLTSVALGRSLQRVFRAYRADGAEAKRLRELITAGQKKLPAVVDPELRDPAKLPEALGDCGLGLPDMIKTIPVPIAAQALGGGKDFLVNYPPMFDAHGKKRKDAPDFASYFAF
jgi:hypothetical protein